MYCTGGTECTPGSYSVMSVIRTLLRVDHKIPLHQERNHAVMVSLASNILPQFKKICYESKMEETPKNFFKKICGVTTQRIFIFQFCIVLANICTLKLLHALHYAVFSMALLVSFLPPFEGFSHLGKDLLRSL